MSNLGLAQDMVDESKIGFTPEERDRIAAFKVPGDDDWKRDTRYFPRKPVINVRQWYEDWSAKLTGLLTAESGR